MPEIAGPLRTLGALEINTSVLGFGGLSGLHLSDDLTLTAISDLARFAQMRLLLDARMQPTGLTLLRAGPLRDGSGAPLPPGYVGDAEALARLPDGTWLVGFERWHRILAYADLGGPGRYVGAPPGLDRSPANSGLESLAVLPDGRWLAIAEGQVAAGDASVHAAWIGGPGQWRRIGYRPEPGMLPVDAAALPDGGALVLERAFTLVGGFWGRLVRIPASAMADAVLQGETLVRLEPPLPPENYEGVAVARHGGRLLVAIVSDDNVSRWQRSLLLAFELTA